MASTSFPVVDAAGNLRQMAHEESPSGTRTPRYVLEVDGAVVGPANPLSVEIPGGIPLVPAGSNGFDYSANPLATPPGVLLLTIPENPDRLSAEVQNQSAADLTLVRDDGANGQRSVVALASGGAIGAQGGSWSTTTFRGRIRVYGPTGSRVSAMED